MHDTDAATPAAAGFRMPAEWTPHDGCWMLWPERPDNWRAGAAPGRRAFAAVAAAISEGEPVRVGASAAAYASARASLPSQVDVVELTADDSWMRDTGPTFVRDEAGRLAGIDWRFNAWGGMYAAHEFDDAVAAKVLEVERAEGWRCPLVMEGGAVHTDGEGTLLTTESVLLDPNRNPGIGRAAAERSLCDHLGAARVIWLPEGVPEDETNGHVDNLCCFIRPAEVLLTWTDDPADPLHPVCRAAEDILRRTPDAAGRTIAVHRIPQPGPLYREAAETTDLAPGPAGDRPMVRPAGSRLAASYVNFYFGNGLVVMPLLDPGLDPVALRVLQDLLPRHRIVGLPSREILLGGGNIHCITQQVPARGPHPFS
ncbi:agmatine deiminase [Marinibaculum pumilum]|uniref:Putative agmatine deiminase n=1 Tax=Marinibaculum pumilum TaxID=1766165 RepID=A0ABV7KZ04_9PROT